MAEQGDRPGQLAAVELVSGQAGGGRAVGGIVEEGLAQGGLGTDRVAVIGKLGDQQRHRGGVAGGPASTASARSDSGASRSMSMQYATRAGATAPWDRPAATPRASMSWPPGSGPAPRRPVRSGLAAPVEPPGIREAVELSLMVLLAGAHPVVAGAAEGEAALLEPGGLEQLPEGRTGCRNAMGPRSGRRGSRGGFLAAARRDRPSTVPRNRSTSCWLSPRAPASSTDTDIPVRTKATRLPGRSRRASRRGRPGRSSPRQGCGRPARGPTGFRPRAQAIMVVPVQDHQVRGEEHPPLRDLIGGEAVGQDRPLDQMGGQRQDIGGGGPHRRWR